MAHFLLTYDLAPDYLERRAALRDAHLALAWAAARRAEGHREVHPPDPAARRVPAV